MSPLSNCYVEPEALHCMEAFYPLHARVCAHCFLVQLPMVETPQRIFADYAYFSSYSDTWLEHARRFAAMMIERFHLEPRHRIVEIASNDGYLLRYFVEAGLQVLGIEPAANVAKVALQQAIPTRVEFFGLPTARQLSRDNLKADLLVANNVLAHVPELNDFVAGMKTVLQPQGIISVEVPHLLHLIQGCQFDTIYHEHFSYFSLITLEKIFASQGLTVFDVEPLPTHGGSLRLFARHDAHDALPVSSAVAQVKRCETQAGLTALATYAAFAQQVRATKRALLQFLIDAKGAGNSIAAYGAPAKGNTLLNYCGIGTDFIEYTVDRNPHKQGRWLPGSRIPICPPDRLRATRPDYLLILPWNLKDEIISQTAYIREWGGKFVLPIPRVEVLS